MGLLKAVFNVATLPIALGKDVITDVLFIEKDKSYTEKKIDQIEESFDDD